MSERTLIVCMRREDMSGEPFPGSTREECLDCGVEIWSDPDLRAMVVEMHGVDPDLKCIDCARPELGGADPKSVWRQSWELMRKSAARFN